MNRSRLAKSLLGLGLLVWGSLTQFNCAGALAQFNPCGTLFSLSFCNPDAYTRLFGNFFESDFRADPTCVIPFRCGNTLDQP
jgi:hypothetical protein